MEWAEAQSPIMRFPSFYLDIDAERFEAELFIQSVQYLCLLFRLDDRSQCPLCLAKLNTF